MWLGRRGSSRRCSSTRRDSWAPRPLKACRVRSPRCLFLFPAPACCLQLPRLGWGCRGMRRSSAEYRSPLARGRGAGGRSWPFLPRLGELVGELVLTRHVLSLCSRWACPPSPGCSLTSMPHVQTPTPSVAIPARAIPFANMLLQSHFSSTFTHPHACAHTRPRWPWAERAGPGLAHSAEAVEDGHGNAGPAGHGGASSAPGRRPSLQQPLLPVVGVTLGPWRRRPQLPFFLNLPRARAESHLQGSSLSGGAVRWNRSLSF